jgi:hypothetical protein
MYGKANRNHGRNDSLQHTETANSGKQLSTVTDRDMCLVILKRCEGEATYPLAEPISADIN